MKKLIYILLLFVLPALGVAQEENASKENLKIHNINGKEYYIHIVEAGNTLYAISRRYAISVDDLKKENPRLSESLTIGDRLMIPVDNIKVKDLKKSPEIDGNFLLHEVRTKSTLYSLAKEYNIEINDILAANPALDQGLKKGMTLKIPVAKIKSEQNTDEYIKPAELSPYITHKVQLKETLYALSKKYNVEQDSILKVNDGLAGGLKVGQLINIPILKETEKEPLESAVVYDSNAVKQGYAMSLLLPLYIDSLENLSDTNYHETQKKRNKLFKKAQYGIEFYQGFKVAADSIAKMGLNLEVRLFDTAHDTARVNQILKDSSFKETDLIIGPLYLEEFMLAADYAKRNKINIVSPVKQSNKILLGNNFVSKVATSEPIRNRFMARFMADSLKDEHMLMVFPDNFRDRNRANSLKQIYYEQTAAKLDTLVASSLIEIMWTQGDFDNIKAKLKKEEMNTFIVPSNNQAFVTQFLTQLNLLEVENIQVFGLEEWQNFQNIDVNYLQNLNVHLVVSEYIDYNSKQMQSFERTFYKRYKVMPEKFAVLGFDVGMYYLSLLNNYGLNFEVMFLGLQEEQLGRKFEFLKTGIESGYENHSVYLIRYADFQRQRVY